MSIIPFISQECVRYLQAASNYKQLLYFQSISGLGMNKLGSYSECISIPSAQYYLISGQSEDYKLFTSGICFNSICSVNDMNYSMYSLLEYVKLPFKVNDISLPGLIIADIDYQSIIVISILFLFLLFILIASIVDCLGGPNKRQGLLNQIKFSNFTSIFSIFTLKKFFQKQKLPILSFIKVLSLLGIMISNAYSLIKQTQGTHIYSQIYSIYNLSYYGVDIWLSVSGFYFAYINLVTFQKTNKASSMLLQTLGRIIRIWPIYVVGILLGLKILPLLGSGPLWPLIVTYSNHYCGNKLGIFLMYCNLQDNECQNWLWVLAVDVQLCLLMSIFMVMYVKKKTNCWRVIFYVTQIVLFGLVFSQIILNKAVNKTNPLYRIGGYMVGMNFGIFYYNSIKQKKEIKIWRKIPLRVTWEILFSCLIITIGVYMNLYFQWIDKIFHTIIPLIVMLAILPALLEKESIFELLFQGVLCKSLSKVCLGMLVVHQPILLFYIYSRKNDLDLSNFMILFVFVSCILPSFILAVLFTFVIEKPIYSFRSLLIEHSSVLH